MTSKSSKVNFSEVLPDDEKIISRNLAWRKILERYSEAVGGDDDEGILISDFVQHYPVSGDILSNDSSASDVCEDENSFSSSSDDDLQENKQQLAVAVKARTNQWKETGLEKIFMDNFTLETKEVMNWLEHCKAGQSKALEREQETRFTELDGDKTLDVSCKRNVSFLNQNGAQQLTSINNSNIELKNDAGRRIIFQQTERTLTTIFDETAGSTTGLALPSSMFSFSNLSVNNIPGALQGLRSALKPKPSKKVTFKPLKPLKKTKLKEPNDSSKLSKKLEMSQAIAPKQVAKMQPKDVVISTSDSDDDKSESLSAKVTRKPANQKRVTFKGMMPDKDLLKTPIGISQQNKEIEMGKEKSSKKINNKHTKATTICSGTDTDDEKPVTHLLGTRTRKAFDKKQTNALKPKPSTSCDGPQIQDTYRNCTSQQKITETKSKNQQTGESSTELTIKSQGKLEELTVAPRTALHSITVKQLANERSDENGLNKKTAADTALQKPNTTNTELTGTKPNNDQHYYMTATMKEQLKIGGRFRYRLQGMVIYRPKQIKLDAPVTERIRITRENLDLGAIEDEKKREKFSNFLYSIHPNSTMVYYMSEDEEEPEAANDGDGSESEDEDDPILTFRPKVCVFEIPYEGPSV
ncbi:uncharacterized protein LOC126577179 [Anopheles aquasalis]|uniref:uncharacterized protein LOC126577179 n=1 Tax=Anopheles aquasalis TaxID=42839 RepID=UPI00215A654A|nr:uncharacterized protein LOC126577179 [Anopheles aquasalis]